MKRVAVGAALAVAMMLAGCSPAAETRAEPSPSPTVVQRSSPTPTLTPTPTPTAEALAPEDAFMVALAARPTLASAIQQADQSVFVEWGQYQCTLLRDGGAPGFLGNIASWGFVEGERADLEAGLLDELHVTESAVTHLCPDLQGSWDEFNALFEQTLNGEG